MYPVPTSLSPSRVEAFTSCPMAFRFASIERLPEAPSPHTTKGSLVHRALELLFTHANSQRTADTARAMFALAVDEFAVDPEFTGLHLDEALLREHAGEGAVHEPDALLELGLLVLCRRLERPLEVVEHGKELLHELLRGTTHELVALAGGALAEVVELGLQALKRVEVIVALPRDARQLVAGIRVHLDRVGLRRIRLDGVAPDRVVGRVHGPRAGDRNPGGAPVVGLLLAAPSGHDVLASSSTTS